jgi:hypothetical protein
MHIDEAYYNVGLQILDGQEEETYCISVSKLETTLTAAALCELLTFLRVVEPNSRVQRRAGLKLMQHF